MVSATVKKWFSYLSIGLTVQIITACQLPTAESKQSSNSKQQTNLISLVRIEKDNTNQQFQGEVYPIAFYVNGNYVDVSNDITLSIRNNLQRQNSDKYTLSKFDRQKSFLNAIKDFTVVSDSGKIGNITVDNLEATQLSCSYFVAGKSQNQQLLSEAFSKIPSDKPDNVTRQTYRSAIAIENYNPTSTKKLEPSEADLNRYKQDLLTQAKTIISKSPETQNIQTSPDIVIEEFSVLDLDDDGNLEVFGKIRKTKANTPSQKSPYSGASPYIYANLWLSYKNEQPQVISSKVSLNTFEDLTSAYGIFSVLDINGDGVKEVVVKNFNFESITFSIYEYKNNQLEEVFTGFNSGC